ncbi:hypothetical protein KQX54_005770 [Cotesia glomerata]|uniref:Uncharacterized protein n=1 Tax=Cotesia glomerata TaxID=32391 RepID=A0AAV7IBC3_COTGL|nr:hypothetical protein KQX54_005770 [Cotesia glomerata]
MSNRSAIIISEIRNEIVVACSKSFRRKHIYETVALPNKFPRTSADTNQYNNNHRRNSIADNNDYPAGKDFSARYKTKFLPFTLLKNARAEKKNSPSNSHTAIKYSSVVTCEPSSSLSSLKTKAEAAYNRRLTNQSYRYKRILESNSHKMSRLTSESLSASHYFETPSSTLDKYYGDHAFSAGFKERRP